MEESDVSQSPVLLCDDASMKIRHDFSRGDTQSSVDFNKSNSDELTCLSMKSDASMENRLEFSKEDANRDQFHISASTHVDGVTLFKLVEKRGMEIFRTELKRYEKMLFPDSSQPSERETKDGDQIQDNNVRDSVLKVTLHVLKSMGHGALAIELKKQIYGELDVCQRKLRKKLKKFEYVFEGVPQHGTEILLNKVYTELYITEGVRGSVNDEHEVRQVQAATRKQVEEEKPIKCEDIFKPLPGQERNIRTALTNGIAGIGKTFSVQKFNLDWAEGRVNQDVQLLINLPFRELNLIKSCYTLTQLLHLFLVEAKEAGISDFGKYKVVMIFDGLDECRLPLDFNNNELCCSVLAPTSVDVLLTNLIKGNLLPSAHIWITSRPAAAGRIPADLIDRVTEIRGFNDPQKDEYFRKKISDQIMADSVISHVKSAKSLYIMCHIPVFSWISATVLQKILEEAETNVWSNEMPKTLTQMYTHYLAYNSAIREQKYSQSNVKTDEEMILKLGKLAFEQLMKGNIIFYEDVLDEYDINVDDAAVCSGVFTQVSKNNFGVHGRKIFSFVHFSIQEFFAALYCLHSFICSHQNILEPQETKTVTDLLKIAVDKTLESENGHLDLFLRFLLGLSQTSSRSLLKSVVTTMASSSQRNDEIIEYIKEKIRHDLSTERCINLFHCLRELGDQTLEEEIQSYLSSDRLPEIKLSTSQWSTLVFILLSSNEELVEFDLRKYSRSENGLLRLLPVIKESSIVLLKECNITVKCCKQLADLLSSSSLKELDLSDNDLQDSGVELLSAGLASPTCRLKKLRLSFCGVTENGCRFLAEALRANPSHLEELDLSYNHPGAVGVKLLSSLQDDIKRLSIRLDGNAECYLKSALKKYACDLTLDQNTAHSHLSISDDNKKMMRHETARPYPDGPERFTDWGQVLCKEDLTTRCYWEAEWTGEWTGVGVAYSGLLRKTTGNIRPIFGYNDKSWGLRYYQGKYTAWYNNETIVTVPYFNSRRVGVFLDWSAGTLSFYVVSENAMTHLHTFHTQFTEPLYPGFRLGNPNSSLTVFHPERI